MRIGEILGLQWKNVHISPQSIENNTSHIIVDQELKRCDKSALQVLDEAKRSEIFFTFPECNKNRPSKSSLVLKTPKTESSVRTIYIGPTVAQDILDYKKQQQFTQKRMGRKYHDYDMVIARADGRPIEERYIAKSIKKLCKDADLPPVVFHSLRALSTSIKLRVSGGDIKAVQGDTGHSQASMVTDIYARTFSENRQKLASQVDQQFFAPQNQNRQVNENPDSSTEELIKLLGDSPKVAELIKAMAIIAKAL